MADNPTKKKADGKRESQQPHEKAYQKRKGKADNSERPVKSPARSKSKS